MPEHDIQEAVPEGYPELLAAAKEQVRQAQISATRRVNNEVVLMYLALGQLILDRQADEGWGTRVIHFLASDLTQAFPGQRGFSERNLRYCRTAARMFPSPIGPQVVAQLGWGHVRTLTDKVRDDETRYWYASQAAVHGWSRNVLQHHIATELHTRVDRSPTQRRSPSHPPTPTSCASWSRTPTGSTSSTSTPDTPNGSSRTPWRTG